MSCVLRCLPKNYCPDVGVFELIMWFSQRRFRASSVGVEGSINYYREISQKRNPIKVKIATSLRLSPPPDELFV